MKERVSIKQYVEVKCKNCGAVLLRCHPELLTFSVYCPKCHTWNSYAPRKKRKPNAGV